jgi:hypothetical protein
MIWQICYTKIQAARAEFTPYLNQGLTPHFENSVIVDLYRDEQLFGDDLWGGVLSWAFRRKNPVARRADMALAVAQLKEYPVVSFYPHFARRGPVHNMFGVRIHGPGFADLCREVFKAVGLPFPGKHIAPSRVVYNNAFLADFEIYSHYIEDALIPAMAYLDAHPERFMIDSGYHKKTRADIRARLEKYLGVPFYPMHPFILERLFSTWLQANKVPVWQYDKRTALS